MISRYENEIEFKINKEHVLMFLDAGCTIVKNNDSLLAKSQHLAFLHCTPTRESIWKIDDAVCLLSDPHNFPVIISMLKVNGEINYSITKISNETLADMLRNCGV